MVRLKGSTGRVLSAIGRDMCRRAWWSPPSDTVERSGQQRRLSLKWAGVVVVESHLGAEPQPRLRLVGEPRGDGGKGAFEAGLPTLRVAEELPSYRPAVSSR